MNTLGFELTGKDHPIIPVILKDEHLTQTFAKKMQQEGILVVGFFYPIVPRGLARIRIQISAVHSFEDLDRAVSAFEKVGKELEVL